MIDIRVGKSVRRVILLATDEAGVITPATLYRKGGRKKKKKGSPGVRQLGKAVMGSAKAQQAFTDTLIKRHRSSNRKRKDGWLRDLGRNVFKASSKGWRKCSKGAGF